MQEVCGGGEEEVEGVLGKEGWLDFHLGEEGD
jgi:hypothetical protein